MKGLGPKLAIVLFMLLSCGDGKKKVAGGYMDETETTDINVSGLLLDSANQAYAYQSVKLNSEYGYQLFDSTDASGAYLFQKVNPGRWYLVVEGNGQGLLREVMVDSIDLQVETATLEPLQKLILVRSQQTSDTVYIKQLGRKIIFASDTMEIMVPKGDYDVVAIDEVSQISSSSSGARLMSSTTLLSSTSSRLSSSLPKSSADLDLSSFAFSSSSEAGTLSSSSKPPAGSSSSVAIISSNGVTLRYLFTTLSQTLDSSGNNLTLSVSKGTPLFATGFVSFYGSDCIKSPYYQGELGTYMQIDARIKLKGNATSGVQGIFCNDEGSGIGDSFCLRRRGLDTLEVYFKSTSQFADSISYAGVAQNTWTTMRAEFAPDSTVSMYLDGSLVVSKRVTPGFYGLFPADNRLGCRNETLSEPQYFYGDVDSLTVRILK